jgi:hypothetical protein
VLFNVIKMVLPNLSSDMWKILELVIDGVGQLTAKIICSGLRVVLQLFEILKLIFFKLFIYPFLKSGQVRSGQALTGCSTHN